MDTILLNKPSHSKSTSAGTEISRFVVRASNVHVCSTLETLGGRTSRITGKHSILLAISVHVLKKIQKVCCWRGHV